MFEQKAGRYWYDKEINYGRLSERWKSKGKKQLKAYLETFSVEELKLIDDKLSLASPKSTDKADYLKSILESKEALQLFLLHTFFEKFKKSVLDYVTGVLSGNTANQNPFINLFLLFLDSSKDHLLNIFIYHNWNAASTGKVYKSSNPLPEDIASKFYKEANAFAKKLSSKDWYLGKKKVRFIGSTDSTFIFDKQVGDKILQTTSGHKRVKPSRYILIRLQPQSVEIREVRRSSRNIAENIRKLIETQFSTELIDETQTPTKGNLETFLKRLKNTNSSDEFEIISFKAKHSKLDKGIPVEVDNFEGGSDISKAITELVDREIIVLNNLSDIDRFTVSFSKAKRNGKRKTIRVNENEDGTLTLTSDSKELKDEERQDFSNLFAQRFGIGLNVPLDPTHLVANQKLVFDYLLSEERVDNPKKFQLDAIKKLEELGVITTKKQFQLRCTNSSCRHKMYSQQESDTCRDCGSQATKINEAIKLEVSEKGTSNYIRGILSKSSKVAERTNRTIKIKNTKFKFYELEISANPVFVHLNFGRVTKTFLDYLVRSGLPLLFINISKVVNTSDMEERLFEQIDLSDILIDEDAGLKGIEERLEKLQTYSMDRISNAARRSYKNFEQKIAQPAEYPPKEFETDVFNILKQIFPSAYRAGGKYVPEGFVGLEYETDRKHKCVFEWDCKLAKTSTYKLPQSEIDKAWRYIRSTLKSDELKNFNKRLNHYIIFSNAIDQSAFRNFATALNRKRKWRGEKSVVLFHTDALLELHSQYANNQKEITRRLNLFYEEFFKLLSRIEANLGYCNINKEDITSIFKSVLAKPAEYDELNAAKVEAHLKQDED